MQMMHQHIFAKKEFFHFSMHLSPKLQLFLKNWFKINEMKSHSDKCHMIVAENEHRPAYVTNTYIYLEDEKELLENENRKIC